MQSIPSQYGVAKMTLTATSENPISDNTNILWNSPSLGKNAAIGYPWFYKTTPFLAFEGKKSWSNLSIFSGLVHYLECVKNSQKSVKFALF